MTGRLRQVYDNMEDVADTGEGDNWHNKTYSTANWWSAAEPARFPSPSVARHTVLIAHRVEGSRATDINCTRRKR